MIERERQTKIVATVGPATASGEALRGLIDAGVDVLRLNSSHGTQEEKAAQIETIRRVSIEASRHVGILLDLQGPKIRVGQLPPDGIELREGESIRFFCRWDNKRHDPRDLSHARCRSQPWGRYLPR